MISSYSELNDKHIDILTEIGNIGMGNAATSFGVLLNEDVSIDLPKVKVCAFSDVVGYIGEPDELGVGAHLKFSGDARGVILFIMPAGDAEGIMDILVAEDDSDAPGLSELKLSGVKEIGNILASAYLGSIASLMGMKIDLSIPQIEVDTVGAMLAAPISEYRVPDSKVMFIKGSFSTKGRKLNGNIVMFVDMDMLRGIMDRLELDYELLSH
jgi:chemotaxis protein CheC